MENGTAYFRADATSIVVIIRLLHALIWVIIRVFEAEAAEIDCFLKMLTTGSVRVLSG